MKEKLRHLAAFEYYYSLGDSRSDEKVAKKIGVSETSVRKWKHAFHWQERVQQRDIELSQAFRKKIEAQTNETILNMKAEYRATIAAIHEVIKESIGRLQARVKKGDVPEVRNMNDMKKLTEILDKIARLDAELMGEAPEKNNVIEVNLKGKDD